MSTSERRLPRRVRPFEKTQRPTPWLQRALIGRELAPSRVEYERACAALWDGDPLMDAVVEWLFEVGPKQGKPLFERALNEGLESVPDAPPALRAFFERVEQPPDWVDPELAEEGARFCRRLGLTATFVLRDLALMGGYLLSGFNQTLVKTGALNKGTAKRIAETGKWWVDCTDPGGMQRFAPGFKTTVHVRLVHALVRRGLAKRSDWDAEEWGLPISQIDMAATYLGFCVAMLGGVRLLGVPVSKRESAAVMQLWSYAGWLMGVSDEWIRLNENEGIVLLHHATLTQGQPDWTSRELGKALSEEPLERHFESFQGLRRSLAWHQHLSVSRYFLGAKKMAQLGLPSGVTPWYPLLTLAPRFLGFGAQRLLPSLQMHQERRGREAQIAALSSLFGSAPKQIIRPEQGHPAHL
ncbi:MAG: DUF2236 domain-containing protein [Myxococcales bacterium]|nr:DUF2236 domain-containing protein [Myxococcales bacterium]